MTSCPDCRSNTIRRTKCIVCLYLLCGECYREHQQGNEAIPGGCYVRMDALKNQQEAPNETR